MFRSSLFMAVSALMLFLPNLVGAEKPVAKPPVKMFTSIAAEVPLATTIDFAGDLGLDIASLKTLGIRIEQAQAQADPVALALAATELAIGEKLAKKKLAITAEMLWKETVDMVQRRNHAAELKAVAMLVSDEKLKESLEKQAKAAGERKRGIQGSCIVYNNANRTMAIFINGTYMGNVAANNEGTFFVGHVPGQTTELLGRAGRFKWGPTYVPQEVNDYRWTLNPLKE